MGDDDCTKNSYRDLAAVAVMTLYGIENLQKLHLPLGNLPSLFGTWVVETQSLTKPKEDLHGKILTRKELYRGQVFAKHTLLLRGPFTPAPGSKVVFGFDQDESSLTITREEPGNETAFLKPSQRLQVYSRDGKVSISAEKEDFDVDFVVHVPVPELKLIYLDEDLHIQRQLTVELTEAGRLSQCEVLYDKMKNTVTRLFSTMTKISNDSLPMYKLIDCDRSLNINVGKTVGSVQPRKQPCCTRCNNPTKGHLGPTGKLCNMNKR